MRESVITGYGLFVIAYVEGIRCAHFVHSAAPAARCVESMSGRRKGRRHRKIKKGQPKERNACRAQHPLESTGDLILLYLSGALLGSSHHTYSPRVRRLQQSCRRRFGRLPPPLIKQNNGRTDISPSYRRNLKYRTWTQWHRWRHKSCQR
jgi:hypothetical protein